MKTPEAPVATAGPAPQTGDPFVNISPPGLASSGAGEEQVVESFAGGLYLGLISYDAVARLDLRRILRFEGRDLNWTTLHRTSVSAAGRDEPLPPPEAGQAAGSAAAAVLPGPGAGRLVVRLSSPLATHALLSRDGREFIPIAAAAPEVSEAFSVRLAARSPRHRFALSWFAGHPHLRQAQAHEEKASWSEVALPQRPDGAEASIGALAVFGEHLVIGVNDAVRGFELFRLAEANPQAWESMIVRGGQRFSPNAAVLAVVCWNDALYLVAGRGAQSAKERPWLPQGFEIIRVYPDFTWDVIVGAPRVTDSGLKIPLAGLAPGLDDFRPADFRCLAAHGDELLLGTYEDVEGFRVWTSRDGEQWSALPHLELSGHGNVRGARFHSTDAGVILELDLDDPGQGRRVSLWLRQGS